MARALAALETPRALDGHRWAASRSFFASRTEAWTPAAAASVSRCTSARACPVRRRKVRPSSLSRRPTERLRSLTRSETAGTAASTWRAVLASTRTASAASPASVG